MNLNDPEVIASLNETAANLIRATEMLRAFKDDLEASIDQHEAFVAELEESVYGRPVPPKPRLSLVSTDEGD
jgi:hypothetical protein